MTRPRWRLFALLVPLTSLLAGLLFATSAETAQGTDLRGGRRLQLTDLIAQERVQVDRQEAVAAALRRDVAAGTEQASARNEQVAQARAEGVVHQQDVQAVVNALWAGGAEAMTLMGQRVISTSAVRCVGNTVVLHGQVYGPPFVVTAIGDQDRMRTALDLEPGVELFQRYVERFGLGYAVTAQDEVRLPAYEGPLQLPSVVPLG